MTYTLAFRATVPVEPFWLHRQRRNPRTRQFDPYEIEVRSVSVYAWADDPVDTSLSSQVNKIRKDGQPSERSEYEGISWDELPQQAKDALRAAYAEAVANVKPVLNEGLE
jgi:hypothetical protein